MVSVVVVTRMSADDVLGCVVAVRRSLVDTPHEIIVVDNGSTDGTVGRIRGRVDAIVENPGNAGFARAANQGAARARGRYLAFVNPDARPRGGCLSMLVRWLHDHPRAGAVGPTVLNPDGSIQWTGGRAPSVGNAWRSIVPVARGYSAVRPGYGGRVDWILGACLVVRSGAFRALGGFDEGFFLYGEDKDLCTRLVAAGWTCHLGPFAPCVHRGGGSGGRPAWLGDLFYRAQGRYLGRHLGGRRAYWAAAAMGLGGILRCLVPAGSRSRRQARREFHWGWRSIGRGIREMGA